MTTRSNNHLYVFAFAILFVFAWALSACGPTASLPAVTAPNVAPTPGPTIEAKAYFASDALAPEICYYGEYEFDEGQAVRDEKGNFQICGPNGLYISHDPSNFMELVEDLYDSANDPTYCKQPGASDGAGNFGYGQDKDLIFYYGSCTLADRIKSALKLESHDGVDLAVKIYRNAYPYVRTPQYLISLRNDKGEALFSFWLDFIDVRDSDGDAFKTILNWNKDLLVFEIKGRPISGVTPKLVIDYPVK